MKQYSTLNYEEVKALKRGDKVYVTRYRDGLVAVPRTAGNSSPSMSSRKMKMGIRPSPSRSLWTTGFPILCRFRSMTASALTRLAGPCGSMKAAPCRNTRPRPASLLNYSARTPPHLSLCPGRNTSPRAKSLFAPTVFREARTSSGKFRQPAC